MSVRDNSNTKNRDNKVRYRLHFDEVSGEYVLQISTDYTNATADTATWTNLAVDAGVDYYPMTKYILVDPNAGLQTQDSGGVTLGKTTINGTEVTGESYVKFKYKSQGNVSYGSKTRYFGKYAVADPDDWPEDPVLVNAAASNVAFNYWQGSGCYSTGSTTKMTESASEMRVYTDSHYVPRMTAVYRAAVQTATASSIPLYPNKDAEGVDDDGYPILDDGAQGTVVANILFR